MAILEIERRQTSDRHLATCALAEIRPVASYKSGEFYFTVVSKSKMDRGKLLRMIEELETHFSQRMEEIRSMLQANTDSSSSNANISSSSLPNTSGIANQPSQNGFKFPDSMKPVNMAQNWKAIGDVKLEKVHIAESIPARQFDFKEFAKSHLTEASFDKSAEAYQQFYVMFKDSKLPPGSHHFGICSHCIDISKFIFSKAEAAKFTTNMSSFYQGYLGSLFNYPVIKSFAMVAFEMDNFFFRGFVLQTNSNFSELFAIDYGFITSLKNESIHPLADEFSPREVNAYSAICGVGNIAPIQGDWSLVANKTFRTFVHSNFTIMVRQFTNGTHKVEIELTNKNLVGEMLKKFKLAKEEL